MNAISTAALLLAACNRQPQQPAASNESAEIASAPHAANPTATAKVLLPQDRKPLTEPKAPIDPKSTEAAGQVVQSYGTLMEEKRFAQAAKLWGHPELDQITAQLRRDREVHFEVGKPGDSEGAAGSIYVTVPVVIYGVDAAGKDFRRPADVILRRVNDVPGSTEAQRRWHIERIDWKAAA
jgi:hypothetical protein